MHNWDSGSLIPLSYKNDQLDSVHSGILKPCPLIKHEYNKFVIHLSQFILENILPLGTFNTEKYKPSLYFKGKSVSVSYSLGDSSLDLLL